MLHLTLAGLEELVKRRSSVSCATSFARRGPVSTSGAEQARRAARATSSSSPPVEEVSGFVFPDFDAALADADTDAADADSLIRQLSEDAAERMSSSRSEIALSRPASSKFSSENSNRSNSFRVPEAFGACALEHFLFAFRDKC